LKEVLAEREEELLIASDKVAELQATQNETHDQLEETLKNIEKDNAEKDADLIAANREIEVVRSLRPSTTNNQLTRFVVWSKGIRA
jgi:ribosomal protein L11 methylase PrmA